MAFLRSKQIKLNAVGDLLVGGVGGAGTVLPLGSNGQFLKVVGGALVYGGIASTEVTYAGGTTVGAELDAIDLAQAAQDLLITGLRTDVDATSDIVDAINLSAGFNADGTFIDFAGTDYLDASTSLTTALTALDAALANLAENAANDTFTNTGVGARALVSTTKDAAINEVFAKSTIAKNDPTNAPTINDDSADGYKVGDIWINGVNAYVALDVTAGAAVWSRIDQNLNAALFTYKGTIDASASESIPVAPESGDTYKVTVAGNFGDTPGMPFVNAGDFIVYTGAGWDKIDSTDTTVAGDAGKITVTGSTDLGYTITIDSGYVGQASITTVGTITTGTWEGTVIGQAFGGTGITVETVAGDAGKVLTVGAAGVLEYAYVSALKDSAGVNAVAVSGTGASAKLVAVNATVGADAAGTLTTKGYVDAEIAAIVAGASTKLDEDFVVGAAPAADYEFDLSETPVGTVSVYFNGLKLPTTGYTVTGVTVALIDSVNGYAAEENDVLSVTYMVAGA